jgi:hypothetical protein
MWTTLAFVAALQLSPAQAGKLTLTNDAFTYGMLGAARNDNKYLPGDSLYLTFEIDNIKSDEQGRVAYSMGMELIDTKGKSWFKQDPRNLEAINSLGGSRLPAFAHVHIGLDQPPGAYTLRVTVNDLQAKTTATLDRKFEVLPPGFGIVRLQLSYIADPPQQMPAPPFAAAGQFLWVNFAVTGFQRDSKKVPNLRAELNVLDDKGQPVHAKPYFGLAGSEVNEAFKVVPMQFVLALNRPGKFTVQLKVIDQVSMKQATMAVPIVVYPSR